MLETLRNWLETLGLEGNLLHAAVALGAAIALALLATIADWVAKRIILRVLVRVITRSRTDWDDALLEHNVLGRIAHLAPLYILHILGPVAFANFPTLVSILGAVVTILMVIVFLSAIDGSINAFLDVYQRLAISRRIYIKGFVQVTKFFVYTFGFIVILSKLLGRSPLVLLSGLGAFTAVLILVFKDSILGFVAGIQLMSNNMVRKGDWIELPKYGIDGDVLDVTLLTVKVQNFDKTIATVPTYALISDSFRNWRGMSESGGRRIKRAISIDMNSVRFCNEEMLQRFRGIQHIAAYIDNKQAELDEYNRNNNIDTSLLVNGRHMTNLGTLRAYLIAYLRHHPKIHQELTFLVRQLKPTSEGVPIEIYVFANDNRWVEYEAIQADIFDHVLSILPLFDLRAYQAPSGSDVRALRPKATS